MSLADYLAKNYTSKNKKDKKDKKSKKKPEATVDVNVSLTRPRPTSSSTEPGVISNESPQQPTDADKKKSGWTVVGSGVTVSEPLMASGAKAGLQTGAQVAEQIRAKEQREREMLQRWSAEGMGKDAETVYRDTGGARVDMGARLTERKRKRDEERAEAERRKKEMNMGLVQKLDMEEKKRKLDKAASSSLSTYADDSELNAQQRTRELEDDPMLSFKPGKSKKYVSRTGRKLYRGAYPENRFNIAPGYRWDGVDRSNGFERAYFRKQQETQRDKTLSYTMQED